MKKTIKKFCDVLLMTVLIMQFVIIYPTQIDATSTKIGVINYSQGKYLKSQVTSSSTSDVILFDIPTKEVVTILQEKHSPAGNNCSNPWHYVEYKGIKGYICGTDVEIKTISQISSSDINFIKLNFPEFTWQFLIKYKTNYPEKKLNQISSESLNYIKENFPNSYQEKIILLKSLYPNWNFVAHETGLDWKQSVNAESVDGRSLIQTTYSPYLDKSSYSYDYEKTQFIPKDGETWFNANAKTIEYYLDPRNFLDETNVFMFETLSYIESDKNVDIAQKLLSINNLINYPELVVNAGKTHNVNSTHLAARIAQEIGKSTTAVSGTVPGYEGYYNFYNIGAYSGPDNVYKGLQRAKDEGWDSPEKSIFGGARFISGSYISKGQNTVYFQKWDVSKNSSTKYSHQYMQNIQAPISEAKIAYKGYVDLNILNNSFTFEIPIYSNMPEETALPTGENSNNYLKNIQINNQTISGFNKNTSQYTVYLPDSASSINLKVETEDSSATVVYDNVINVETNETTYTIKSVAQDGSVRIYTIKFIKQSSNEIKLNETVNQLKINIEKNVINNLNFNSDITKFKEKISKLNADVNVTFFDKNLNMKNSGKIATGDKVMFILGDKSLEYKIIVKGDSNGDGDISLIDLLHVQKYILESMNLDDLSFKALDINNDNQVNLFDLLKIQLHILGVSEIKGDVINEA